MKNKISTLLCLSLLLGLCGCSTTTPIPDSDSSLSEVPISSSVTSEIKTPSITLSKHEVTIITDSSKTISFKTKNFRGDVLVAISNPDVCIAKIDKKDLIIDGLQAGTAVLTVIAGEARDELTVAVEQRTIAFKEHEYSLHSRSGVWCPFVTNGEYNEDIKVEIFDLDNSEAQPYAYVDCSRRAVHVDAWARCNFKVKITSHDAYDVMSFNFYITPWPEGASQYNGQNFVVRDLNGNIPNVCAVLTPNSYGNSFGLRSERGTSVTNGNIFQCGVKDGNYYFGYDVFDLNIESLPPSQFFLVFNFETFDIWADFSINGESDSLFGPNFEPFHLTTFTETEDIVFESEQTYHVGETVTFVSRPTNEDADYYSFYEITYQDLEERDAVESIDPFNRTVVFHKPCQFRLFAIDKLTQKSKEALVTVVE